ncbi:triosephosphate isomerase [Candidatus Daviesbacteria bacterium]|nr:triosephosphate isomerase [Candidatus Daviesbacteria bacterium]
MKNLWIVANWKSNKTIEEALEWVGKVGPKIKKEDFLKVVVCPTFSVLSEVKKAIQVGNFPLLVGCQDLSPFDKGAYTGEESASLLKQLVDLAIIGHSERRYNFGETDQQIENKLTRASQADIIGLLCVQGNETPVPKGCQLIAYEPISAISTGLDNTPGSGQPEDPLNASSIATFFKQQHGQDLEVLYGGSVTGKNVKQFISQKEINGVLVGNASLDATEFIKIVEEAINGA